MIAQRPAGAAPCVQASAESIPLDDGACDVALAVLTIHHWDDLERGLAELRRGARRQVILPFDGDLFGTFWLVRDYLPESQAWEQARFPTIDRVVALLGGDVSVEPVPVPHDCED